MLTLTRFLTGLLGQALLMAVLAYPGLAVPEEVASHDLPFQFEGGKAGIEVANNFKVTFVVTWSDKNYTVVHTARIYHGISGLAPV